MQFGIFTVTDITTDPTTGKTPSEYERQQAIVQIAKKAENIKLLRIAFTGNTEFWKESERLIHI